MKIHAPMPWWSIASPLAGWFLLGGALLGAAGGFWLLLMTTGLIAGVLAAVHHAEVVATYLFTTVVP